MVHWGQRRLSRGQQLTLVRFLTNAGTITLGGLIFGPFISQRPFRMGIFVVGVLLYSGFLGTAIWLSHDRVEERE